MTEFVPRSVCILGRQPAIGLAELESLYGAEHIRPLGSFALVDIAAEDINFTKLGGTIKVAKLLTILPTTKWQDLVDYLIKTIPEHLKYVPAGKFTLGVSAYDLNIDIRKMNASLLQIKKVIKKSGRSVRVVPNKSSALNSAQVLHNKLTNKGAWELVFIKDSSKTILAQTMFIQDIEAYGARDQVRPKRDARVGMLPPKLAQQIINLAVGTKKPDKKRAIRILDPFCGTGVILQEALLMNYHVFGTDNDPRMIEYAENNIRWLIRKYPKISGHVSIELADGTTYKWPRFTAVASEAYLGKPLVKLPDANELKRIVSGVDIIIKKFFENLSLQLVSGQRICVAVPAWRQSSGKLIHLPLLAKLTDMRYNKVKFIHVRCEDLVYYREDQVVARELLVLEKV